MLSYLGLRQIGSRWIDRLGVLFDHFILIGACFHIVILQLQLRLGGPRYLQESLQILPEQLRLFQSGKVSTLNVSASSFPYFSSPISCPFFF